MRMRMLVTILAMAAMTVAHAQQPPPSAAGGQADAIAALKQSLQQGLAKARQYEWVETTVITLKGEEKARKQQRCYYGADGKVQKVPLDQGGSAKPADSGKGRGGRGGKVKAKVVENKKSEMSDYMERAAQLVHSYVPPAPERIQAAKDEKRVTVTPRAGGGVHVVIKDYRLAGDSLAIDIDPATNRLLSLAVSSYLGTPEDPVTLDVQMNTLPDGALYAAHTTLDAKAKNIRVAIDNAGHRPSGS
jgi:hypothetical protein